MHYVDWGFSSNPFDTTSLSPNETGSKLLVDRDDLIKTIQQRISAGTKVVTIEGLNGVGKTSLINVAVFRHFKARLSSERGPFLVPCRSSFQLIPSESAEVFRRRVLIEIAQTLIEKKNDLPVPRGLVKAPSNSAIDK